jgi:hypothetical protein
MIEDKPKDFGERFVSLVRFDRVRITRILENVQYGAVYAFCALFLGSLLDHVVRPLYPKGEPKDPLTWRGFWRVAGAVVVQVILNVIVVFYMRKLADLMPPVINLAPHTYLPHYHVTEFTGELALALVFIATQTTLLDQVGRARRFLFKED